MEATNPANFWRKCSACKESIGFNKKYYICSVSTCNGQRTGYVFCKRECFERHLPGARHRDAGSIEKQSPATADAMPATFAPVTGETRAPTRILIKDKPVGTSGVGTASASSAQVPREVLVIASRLKEYITARSEFNTSGAVMDVLSDHLRRVCDEAIETARADGRKTVLDRDLEFLRSWKKG